MSDAHPPPSSPTPTNDDGGAAPDPWRTALLARAATAQNPGNYGAWATLGLAQAMMGNYSAAITAYRRAWDLDGGNPWYAHNLGHLLAILGVFSFGSGISTPAISSENQKCGAPWIQISQRPFTLA